MNKIFYGLLLVFLDFSIILKAQSIDLLPDWAGYLLILYGLKELVGRSSRFAQARPWCIGMAIYSAAIWLADIFIIRSEMTTGSLSASWLLSIVSVAVSIYISYLIVEGVGDMERENVFDLGYDLLKKAWVVESALTIAVYLFMIIPILAFICIIVGLIAAIVFLVAFNKSRKAYDRMISR